VKSHAKAGNIDLTMFTLPLKAGETAADHVIYFLHNDQIVLTDSRSVAEGIAGRFGQAAADSLAKLPAFEHSMAKNAQALATRSQTSAGSLSPSAMSKSAGRSMAASGSEGETFGRFWRARASMRCKA
jgi:hypothetical protein